MGAQVGQYSSGFRINAACSRGIMSWLFAPTPLKEREKTTFIEGYPSVADSGVETVTIEVRTTGAAVIWHCLEEVAVQTQSLVPKTSQDVKAGPVTAAVWDN